MNIDVIDLKTERIIFKGVNISTITFRNKQINMEDIIMWMCMMNRERFERSLYEYRPRRLDIYIWMGRIKL